MAKIIKRCPECDIKKAFHKNDKVCSIHNKSLNSVEVVWECPNCKIGYEKESNNCRKCGYLKQSDNISKTDSTEKKTQFDEQHPDPQSHTSPKTQITFILNTMQIDEHYKREYSIINESKTFIAFDGDIIGRGEYSKGSEVLQYFPTVSKEHIRVYKNENGEWYIENLSKVNKTLVESEDGFIEVNSGMNYMICPGTAIKLSKICEIKMRF